MPEKPDGKFRSELRTLLSSVLSHSKLILFIDQLFMGLKAMLDQIIDEGNYFTKFETGPTLKSWDAINSDMQRLIEPFYFAVFYDKAINVIPTSQKASIHCLRSEIEKLYQDELKEILEIKRKKDISKERLDIERKLEGGVIINMSDKTVPPELIEEFSNGKSFIRDLQDYGSEVDIKNHRFLREEIANLLNRMYFWGSNPDINLSRNRPIKDEVKMFHWKTLEHDIVCNLTSSYFSNDDVLFLKNITSLLEDSKPDLNLEKFQKTAKLHESLVLIEADKGQGIVLLRKDDLLRMYERNDKKHGFIKTDLTENDVVIDNLERRDYLASLIPKDVYENLDNKIKKSLIQPHGMAPIFRPLGKVQKLDCPSYKDIDIFSSRMIKSSSGAPHNVIAEVASKMTEPLINELNQNIVDEFGWKPAMQDCVEVFNRLSQDDIMQSPDKLIGIEGDAVDMYLMLDFEIIIKDIEEILEFFEKDEEFVEFYTKAVETLMRINYWRQPGGIYTVGPKGPNGFSIGCFLAANGSELVMVWREGRLLMLLKKKGLLKFVKLLSRYKDDFLLLLLWHPTETVKVVQAVCEAFPSSLQFKFKISTVRVDFVDQSLYINQSQQNYVKLLRKAESSYDYPRKTTNMKDATIYGTIHSCVRRSLERNTLESDVRLNEDLYRLILRKRGFKNTDYSKIRKVVLNRKSKGITKPKWDSKGKVFSGVITFDKKSRSHRKISKMLYGCGFPQKYQPPLPNRGKKIWQTYFKKRSYISDMDSFLEKNKQRS